MRLKKNIEGDDKQRGYCIIGIAITIVSLMIAGSWLRSRIHDYTLSPERIPILDLTNQSDQGLIPGETDIGVKLRTVRADLNEDGEYRPTDGDPQIILGFAKHTVIQSIGISFKIPLIENTEIQLYYAEEGQSYSEERAKRVQADQGTLLFLTDLPAGLTQHLRVDINGACVIEKISISPEGIQKSINWRIVPLILMCLVCLGLAITLFILIIYDARSQISREGGTAQISPHRDFTSDCSLLCNFQPHWKMGIYVVPVL